MKGLVRFLKGYKLACFGVVVFMFVQVGCCAARADACRGHRQRWDRARRCESCVGFGACDARRRCRLGCGNASGTYVSASIATGVSRDMAMCTVTRKPIECPISRWGDCGVASLITRSTSDVNQIQQALLVFIEMLLPVPFMVVIGMALMFSKDPVLAAGIVGVMIAIVVAFLVLSRVVIPYFERLQRQLDTMNLTVRESIAGVRIVRAFRRTGWDRRRMEVAAGDYAATAIKTNRIFAVVVPFVMLLFNATTFAILFVGGNQVAEGSLRDRRHHGARGVRHARSRLFADGCRHADFHPPGAGERTAHKRSARKRSAAARRRRREQEVAARRRRREQEVAARRGRRKREVAARQGRRERRCHRRATRTQLRSHCRTAGPRPTCRRIQGRRLFLRRSREPRAEGRELRGQPGRDHGHHRRNGLRKIHDREPSHGLLRSTSRRYSRRRKTPRLVPCNRPAQAYRLRSAEAVRCSKGRSRTTCATALRVRPSGRCARRLPPLR